MWVLDSRTFQIGSVSCRIHTMSKIVVNACYLWRQVSTWLKWFTGISFLIVYLILTFVLGPFLAAAAVVGVTIVMLGILGVGFLRYTNKLWFFVAIGVIYTIAYVLHSFRVSPGVAGIVAACVTGWGVILYALASYKP